MAKCTISRFNAYQLTEDLETIAKTANKERLAYNSMMFGRAFVSQAFSDSDPWGNFEADRFERNFECDNKYYHQLSCKRLKLEKQRRLLC